MENLKVIYEQICLSHRSISQFRGQLLALLPVVSGAGIFLLLNEDIDLSESGIHLFPVGIFGALISLGFFIYELRGLQRCRGLIACAKKLEAQILVDSRSRFGPFQFRQDSALGGMLGSTGAALIIYPSVISAWFYVAFFGLYLRSVIQEGAVIYFVAGVFLLFVIFGLLVSRSHRRALKTKLIDIEAEDFELVG